MKKLKLGFAITGSFCTLEKALETMGDLCHEKYDITPILSSIVATTSSRFMKLEDLYDRLKMITPRSPITTIHEAEPIGPKKLFDAIVVAPCTGNTLAKIALGITDTPVTMAVKAGLRNEIPIVIAPSTNDALAASHKNIGLLMNTKNVFFVPFSQDDPEEKHRSMVADFSLVEKTLESAIEGVQLQPILK